MNELNPNHGVTREMREEWHKLCAIMLWKSGATEIQITAEDVRRFSNSGLANITIRPRGNVITLTLVSDAEAARLAKQAGGLPV